MKHEWRKHEKQIYNATTSPARLTIPPQQFLILNGSGNPNAPDFSERVSALYTTAYAVKRLYRAGVPADAPFHDFTVYGSLDTQFHIIGRQFDNFCRSIYKDTFKDRHCRLGRNCF